MNYTAAMTLSDAPQRCARPLVVRCGAFGDMVLVTALIRDLSDRFGCDVDVLASGPWSEPLLRGQAGVGEVFSVRSRKTPYWLSLDQRRVVRRLRSRGIGPTWLCDGNDAALPMLRRAGIPGEFIVDSRDHPLWPGEHATQQWRRLAQVLPAGGSPYRVAKAGDFTAAAGGCRLEVSASQRTDLDSWLRARRLFEVPLIAIQVGNKRTMRRGLRRLAANSKYWPVDRWAAVLRHLRARHPSHAIVLLGTVSIRHLQRDDGRAAHSVQSHHLADELVGGCQSAGRGDEDLVVLRELLDLLPDGVRERGDDSSPDDRIDIIRRVFKLFRAGQERHADHLVDAAITKAAFHDFAR